MQLSDYVEVQVETPSTWEKINIVDMPQMNDGEDLIGRSLT